MASKSFLVETIPKELIYPEQINSVPTYEGWLDLINSANHSIDIASMYWTMLGRDVMEDPVPESKKGENIVDALVNANKNRSVKLRIAINSDRNFPQNKDMQILKTHAEIRQVNFTRLIGAGILHTKFLIIDRKHFYLGSANMDWRSLTHVKELGIIVQDNHQLAEDITKIFETYWYLGLPNSTIPKVWPSEFNALFNETSPYYGNLNSKEDHYKIFLTSSPKQFCSKHRKNDLEAILDIIDGAEKFIYIAVMDYFPMFLYEKKPKYWPVIDDALRRAMYERHVNVRLMASHWNHTRSLMPLFLKSLAALNDPKVMKGSIETKMFTFTDCPFKPEKIPFSEVNHNKYMVTDKTAYIGTSNWSADYFVNTGGVGIILNVTDHSQSNLYDQIKNTFLRDWNSTYAKQIV